MADGIIKRLLTRKNLILGGQLAGLALAFSSKKVRDGASDAVKAAGNALTKGDTGAGAPSVAKTVNALVDAPAVAAAAPKAKRAVKAVTRKATPAKVRAAAKPAVAAAKAAAPKVAAAIKPAAPKSASKPGPKPKAAVRAKPGPKPKAAAATAAAPKSTRAKAKPKA